MLFFNPGDKLSMGSSMTLSDLEISTAIKPGTKVVVSDIGRPSSSVFDTTTNTPVGRL